MNYSTKFGSKMVSDVPEPWLDKKQNIIVFVLEKVFSKEIFNLGITRSFTSISNMLGLKSDPKLHLEMKCFFSSKGICISISNSYLNFKTFGSRNGSVFVKRVNIKTIIAKPLVRKGIYLNLNLQPEEDNENVIKNINVGFEDEAFNPPFLLSLDSAHKMRIEVLLASGDKFSSHNFSKIQIATHSILGKS